MTSDLLAVDPDWEGSIYGESDKAGLAADDMILLTDLIRRLSKAPSGFSKVFFQQNRPPLNSGMAGCFHARSKFLFEGQIDRLIE